MKQYLQFENELRINSIDFTCGECPTVPTRAEANGTMDYGYLYAYVAVHTPAGMLLWRLLLTAVSQHEQTHMPTCLHTLTTTQTRINTHKSAHQ